MLEKLASAKTAMTHMANMIEAMTLGAATAAPAATATAAPAATATWPKAATEAGPPGPPPWRPWLGWAAGGADKAPGKNNNQADPDVRKFMEERKRKSTKKNAKIPCPFLQRGACLRGNSCFWLHA
jgi:hypothetical protein